MQRRYNSQAALKASWASDDICHNIISPDSRHSEAMGLCTSSSWKVSGRVRLTSATARIQSEADVFLVWKRKLIRRMTKQKVMMPNASTLDVKIEPRFSSIVLTGQRLWFRGLLGRGKCGGRGLKSRTWMKYKFEKQPFHLVSSCFVDENRWEAQ